jgi:hypothetical protein
VFERFTEKAIKVVLLAQKECRRLGNESLSVEHFLLGLIAESSSAASKCLRSAGFNLKDARLEVEKLRPRQIEKQSQGEIPLDESGQALIDAAWKEAKKLGDSYVAPEHLLLGMTLDKGNAARIISALGSQPDILRNFLNAKSDWRTPTDLMFQEGPHTGPSHLDGQVAFLRMTVDMIRRTGALIPQLITELGDAKPPEENVQSRLPELSSTLQQLDAVLQQQIPSLRKSVSDLKKITERLTKSDDDVSE